MVQKSDLQSAIEASRPAPEPPKPPRKGGKSAPTPPALPSGNGGTTVAPGPEGASVEGATEQGREPLDLDAGEELNEIAEAIGAKPGLAERLGWGQSVLRALGEEDLGLTPLQDATLRTAALGVGTAVHHAGGAPALRGRLEAWWRDLRRRAEEHEAAERAAQQRGG
jgi:hypothetical protein